jgi:hypothetical protein
VLLALLRAEDARPHVADDGAGHDGRRAGDAQACLAPPDADGNGSHVYANLATSAQYTTDIGRDILEAGERFPPIIAAALRKIAG